MITNVKNPKRGAGGLAEADHGGDAGRRHHALLTTDGGRDWGPFYACRPCRVASSIARLEEAERHLAVLRARPAGDSSRR